VPHEPPLPYARPWVDQSDIERVVDVLRGQWLTTGPMVPRLEDALAGYIDRKSLGKQLAGGKFAGGELAGGELAGGELAGAEAADSAKTHVVCLSSGTAALHGMMAALDIGPGDEVIVPALTFAATANAVVYQGGSPVFADVDPDTLLIDPDAVVSRLTPRTRAIVAVDYAGQTCDYPRLRAIAADAGVELLADAAHSLGVPGVGRLGRMSAFSLHAVKAITTGEGGAVATSDPALAQRMRGFRNHGIDMDHRQREQTGAWHYEQIELGYNYRMTDIQAALGLGQIERLDQWLVRRADIARRYNEAFAQLPGVRLLSVVPIAGHAWHLYVVRVGGRSGEDAPRPVASERSLHPRDRLYRRLREAGIGTAVHFPPVHLHPYYRRHFDTHPGQCPVAERAYEEILSLPLFPAMSDTDVARVIDAVTDAVTDAAVGG